MENFDKKTYKKLENYDSKEAYINSCLSLHSSIESKIIEIEYMKSELSTMTIKRKLTNGFDVFKTENVLIDDEAKIYKYLTYKLDYLKKAKDVLSSGTDTLTSESIHFLLVSGIFELQEKRGNKEYFIQNIDSEKNEAGFRDWFCDFFQRHGYKAISEQVKGNKNIDLVVEGEKIGRNKIEFKDWRNEDKKQVVWQLCTKYLTSFDKSGFVFMVNPNKSSIIEKYKELITTNDMNYLEDSWKDEKLNGFSYYISHHNFGAESKIVYHYIFDVYP